MVLLALFALFALIGCEARVPIRTAASLQKVMEDKALQWNTSFSVGVYTSSGAWTAVSGYNDRRIHTPMTSDLRFPLGSVTKPYTCAMVMQAHEKGLIDIDAPISKYVDKLMFRLNETTMSDLWHGDPNVSKITARRLMGMRAGLHEYNDTWYHNIQLSEPNHDVTPFEILHRFNKTWIAPPGTRWKYASTGYELLGLALTAVYGYDTWEDYDQMSVFPSSIRDEYTGTSFPGKGLCAKDPLIIHQYANTPYRWGPNPYPNYTFTDIRNTSCLNGEPATFLTACISTEINSTDTYIHNAGWVCGNIAATPLDIARFHYDLQNGNIVSNASLAMMNDFYNISGTIGTNDHSLYGMYCLYCTVLYFTVLYCTVLHCTVLYCTALHCLYCIDSTVLTLHQ
jgi:hypothetical protein